MIEEYDRLAKQCDREDSRQYFRKRASDLRQAKSHLETELRGFFTRLKGRVGYEYGSSDGRCPGRLPFGLFVLCQPHLARG
jgi:hypothetical protein